MSDDVFIGIDGGGTKTAAVAISRGGRILGSARAGASALEGIADGSAPPELRSVVDELGSVAGVSLGDVKGWGVGLSGIDFADEFAAQHALLSRYLGLPPERLTLVNDGIAALWGASARNAAGIVQVGTGVTAAYRTSTGDERLFDHLDAGSLFDIRRALAARVARMIDGRLPPTPLKDEALRHYGISDETAYAETLYRGRIDAAKLNSTPPLIFDAWSSGDAQARDLVSHMADDCSATASALIGLSGNSQCEVALGGGVINCAPEAFLDEVRTRVDRTHPEASIIRPVLSAQTGAALMAAHAAGVDAADLFNRIDRG